MEAAFKTKLVSHTLAAWPGDHVRTRIGVGEEVELKLVPRPKEEDLVDAVWTVDNETDAAFSIEKENTNDLARRVLIAKDHPAKTVTVKVVYKNGQRTLNKTFEIVGPSGIAKGTFKNEYWDPAYTDAMKRRTYAAGMLVDAFMAPADVNLTKVKFKEISGPASNYTGWYAGKTVPGHVANPNWTKLGTENGFTDRAGFYNLATASPSYIIPQTDPKTGQYVKGVIGTFEYQIPVKWRLGDAGQEFDLPGGWTQKISVEGDGSVTVEKFGVWVRRDTPEYGDGKTTHN